MEVEGEVAGCEEATEGENSIGFSPSWEGDGTDSPLSSHPLCGIIGGQRRYSPIKITSKLQKWTWSIFRSRECEQVPCRRLLRHYLLRMFGCSLVLPVWLIHPTVEFGWTASRSPRPMTLFLPPALPVTTQTRKPASWTAVTAAMTTTRAAQWLRYSGSKIYYLQKTVAPKRTKAGSSTLSVVASTEAAIAGITASAVPKWPTEELGLLWGARRKDRGQPAVPCPLSPGTQLLHSTPGVEAGEMPPFRREAREQWHPIIIENEKEGNSNLLKARQHTDPREILKQNTSFSSFQWIVFPYLEAS